jgi:hypothetical protein
MGTPDASKNREPIERQACGGARAMRVLPARGSSPESTGSNQTAVLQTRAAVTAVGKSAGRPAPLQPDIGQVVPDGHAVPCPWGKRLLVSDTPDCVVPQSSPKAAELSSTAKAKVGSTGASAST